MNSQVHVEMVFWVWCGKTLWPAQSLDLWTLTLGVNHIWHVKSASPCLCLELDSWIYAKWSSFLEVCLLFQMIYETFSCVFLPQYSLVNEPLIELTNPGASGSLFYLTSDDEFIIKTVQHKEAKFLQRLLPGYYMVSDLRLIHEVSST